MKYITYKDILIINNIGGVGFRLILNLSPEEMRRRKKEIIQNVLGKGKLFSWDIELDEIGSTPNPCGTSGLWSYFVKLN